MQLQTLTYQDLENVSKKVYGFILLPIILVFIRMNMISKGVKSSRFQREFFSLLIKKSIIKFNFFLSIVSLFLFVVNINTWLLALVLVSASILSSSLVTHSIKGNVSYLQSIENLNEYKKQTVLA